MVHKCNVWLSYEQFSFHEILIEPIGSLTSVAIDRKFCILFRTTLRTVDTMHSLI